MYACDMAQPHFISQITVTRDNVAFLILEIFFSLIHMWKQSFKEKEKEKQRKARR